MNRIQLFRERMAAVGASAVLIQRPEDVGYLSGFTGSSAVLLFTSEHALFITDSRYAVQASAECPDFEHVVLSGGAGYDQTVAARARTLGVRKLCVEGDYLTLSRFQALKENLGGADPIALDPAADMVMPLRMIKDEDEIAVFREACLMADRALEHILTWIRPGLTEREVALELEVHMRRAGAEKEAFDTIVASGVRSALPHGRASDKLLEAGDFVTMDFGAKHRGYHSDLTRTLVLGPATELQKQVYQTVIDARDAAFALIRDGAAGRAVDAAARDVIRDRGYGDFFGHGLGHGLGRVIHEGPPMLSPRSELTLRAGMIATVEPGIYIPDWGGVRVEDDLLVTESGFEFLTHSTRELIEVAL